MFAALVKAAIAAAEGGALDTAILAGRTTLLTRSFGPLAKRSEPGLQTVSGSF